MKLSKKYRSEGAFMPYLLDVKDGRYCETQMPASCAEEIVRCADKLETCDMAGYELLVNGEMLFPKDGFDFDDSEGPEGEVRIIMEGDEAPKAKGKNGRMNKRELMDKAKSLGIEVNEKMTNKWLQQLIDDAEHGGGAADVSESAPEA